MSVCLIVQARMNSQRLPGKVLMEILEKPLLGYELERLKKSRLRGELLVATSVNPADNPVVEYCKKQGVSCFRGSEEDVLARFYEAAKQTSAETVVRICGDSPLVDPELVDRTIDHYLKNRRDVDYVSNVLKRTFPRGLDCEVFSFKVLDEAYHEATLKSEREHVTPFIYNRPKRYRLGGVEGDEDLSGFRWTVDTEEDFDLIQKILSKVYPVNPGFGMREVLALYEKNPEWKKINERVQQRSL